MIINDYGASIPGFIPSPIRCAFQLARAMKALQMSLDASPALRADLTDDKTELNVGELEA